MAETHRAKAVPHKYVIIASSQKGKWVWQLRSREGNVLVSSERFSSEQEAERSAKEDAQRRQVISEVEYA